MKRLLKATAVRRLAVILVLGAAGAAPSFPQAGLQVARLTEEIIARAYPVLQAHAEYQSAAIAAMQESARAADAERVKGTKIRNDIDSGKDLMGICRSITDQIIYPDGLVYKPKASRAVTEDLDPRILLTYGINASPALIAAYVPFRKDPTFTNASRWLDACTFDSPEGRKATELLERTKAFYEEQGWEYLAEEGSGNTWRSPDGIALAYFEMFNPYTGIEKETAEALPTGPILVIIARLPFNPKTTPPPVDTYTPALEKSGWTREEYEQFEMALEIACRDAEGEADFTPQQYPDFIKDLSVEDAQVFKKIVDDGNAALAVRKANADLYRKHAPLLAAPLKVVLKYWTR